MFWESAVQENTEIMMDASFHMQCNSPSAGLGKLGTLNISSSRSSTLEDYATEHMSFYGDDDGEQTSQQTHNAHHNDDDNTLWHSNEQFLLPDEGPAQRFHIIQKPKGGFQRRKSTVVVVDENAHDHVQRPQDATTTNSNSTRNEKTPSRGFRVFNSLSSSCSMESSMEDDEYMDLFEMESLEEQLQKEQQYQPQNNKITLGLPSNLNSLISGQIKSSLTPRTPEMRRPSVRRCLSLNDNTSPEDFRTQQKSNSSNNNTTACTTPYSSRLTPLLDNNQDVSPFSAFCFKRPDPPSVSNSPIQTKRYRGDEKENLICATSTFANTNTIITTIKSNALSTDVHTNKTTTTTANSISTSSRVILRKSMSMNDAEIMTALARGDNKGEPDLIGDFSKPFVLPLIEGRHRDLKNISSDTVAQLINGAFDDQVANYTIVDCRYPYEYEGGHIRGAKNLYTQEQIIDEFLTQKKTEQQQQQEAAILAAGTTKRNIIIFHCEFSSERGPRMSRFLRNNDRARNTNSYPTLDYPEIYLLHNGYKEFYETHAELCVPNAYRPMLEPAFGDAYRHFRAKSKSWNGDGLGGATSRLKKSRSRLML